MLVCNVISSHFLMFLLVGFRLGFDEFLPSAVDVVTHADVEVDVAVIFDVNTDAIDVDVVLLHDGILTDIGMPTPINWFWISLIWLWRVGVIVLLPNDGVIKLCACIDVTASLSFPKFETVFDSAKINKEYIWKIKI